MIAIRNGPRSTVCVHAASPSRLGGYTLIEMLSVLVVISLLVALVIGLYVNARDSAARRQAQAELGELHHAVQQIYLAFGQYPPVTPAVPATSTDATELLSPSSPPEWLPPGVAFTAFLPPGFDAVDPWNRPYQYVFNPEQPDSYDLFSFGFPGPETNRVRFTP